MTTSVGKHMLTNTNKAFNSQGHGTENYWHWVPQNGLNQFYGAPKLRSNAFQPTLTIGVV